MVSKGVKSFMGRRVVVITSYGEADKADQALTAFLITAHPPATEATIPPEIIIGLMPLVLLKSIPLSAPAATLFAESCLPLR